MEEDTSGSIDFEYFMEDMSEERSTRVAGAIIIIIGSLLGVQFGILQISGTPDEILSGSLDFSERYSDVNGITISSLEGNSSGGDPVEGVKIRLLSEEGATTGRETTSDSNGRFSFDTGRLEWRKLPRRISFNRHGNRSSHCDCWLSRRLWWSRGIPWR